MEKISDIDFQELYLMAQTQLMEIDLNKYYPYVLYILASFALYHLGKRRGQSQILISKRTKLEIQQYKGKQEQKQKQKYELQKESKKLSFLIKLLVFIVLVINAALYYFLILDSELQMYVSLGSVLLVVVTYIYSSFERKKLAKIQASLEMSKKEIDQMIISVGQLLGDEMLVLMKDLLFKKENEEFQRRLLLERESLKVAVELQNKQTIEGLKQKIQQLEDKEFQQKQEIHNFKRATQQHKTEPIINSSVKANEEAQGKFLKTINYLEKESQIQKDMISKIINIEWCQDCINLNNHCIDRYFEQAKKIGNEYESQRKILEAEHSKSNQAIVQQKE